MKSFRDLIGDAQYPVIEFRRTPIYNPVTRERTEQAESCYTALYGYDKIDIKVADDGQAVTQAQVQVAADAGEPIQMAFSNVEITIRPKSQWEIQVTGRASKAAVVVSK